MHDNYSVLVSLEREKAGEAKKKKKEREKASTRVFACAAPLFLFFTSSSSSSSSLLLLPVAPAAASQELDVGDLGVPDLPGLEVERHVYFEQQSVPPVVCYLVVVSDFVLFSVSFSGLFFVCFFLSPSFSFSLSSLSSLTHRT